MPNDIARTVVIYPYRKASPGFLGLRHLVLGSEWIERQIAHIHQGRCKMWHLPLHLPDSLFVKLEEERRVSQLGRQF